MLHNKKVPGNTLKYVRALKMSFRFSQCYASGSCLQALSVPQQLFRQPYSTGSAVRACRNARRKSTTGRPSDTGKDIAYTGRSARRFTPDFCSVFDIRERNDGNCRYRHEKKEWEICKNILQIQRFTLNMLINKRTFCGICQIFGSAVSRV